MTAATVPPELRPWCVAWPGYAPVDVTPPELQPGPGLDASVREGWAEPITDPDEIDWYFRAREALILFDVTSDHRPRNPAGRTGRVGRNLGRWGENQAADPIVVAGDGDAARVLLIRRDDCGLWAIPGGMVDPGETAPDALVRELREETGVDLAGVRPEILARTYVDDPRNTDQAWVCSTVALYRLPVEVEATAGSDAAAAHWYPLWALTGATSVDGLYPPHLPLLKAAHLVVTE